MSSMFCYKNRQNKIHSNKRFSLCFVPNGHLVSDHNPLAGQDLTVVVICEENSEEIFKN